ncbi:hypothetical protein [Pacificibacter marinus]|uniref:hypothetical protein n=1 Tax=Pacificibacter marinus TaxID=658057 RepID=UPI001C06B2AF|nr:hypothetical protein [Pacificibacter marinus]MBU2867024.1 hypothetical protein [Pacificibacter marinus]
MAKAKNTFEKMASDAATRLEKVRAAGEQLALLPDEAGNTPAQAGNAAKGRPKGAKNKGSTQMRDWLASKGYAMPEDMLAQMAGLAKSQDAMVTAMENTERVLSWAYDGATKAKKGGGTQPDTPSGAQRLATFLHLYAVQLRAADALLPYGAPKATPDVQVNQNTTVIVPAQPVQPTRAGDHALDVTPVRKGRMMPADVAQEIEQNQQVNKSPNGVSDAESRTE